ncbi:DUF3054 domain-containing protein [Actinomadura opuntiae]|uniref:DUF3054 domain-containing protein n=1 Tax=Actinomadura sp. OS1-43 TaxID=604315 RepID=UPI00255B1CE5|nr:DUF3054 domain-containing protein [Actinomadura sp. OS1-43]MDL4819111.1 DUF3054 domain-containing protein [Actinomadura sp. OS1-43]
MRNVVAGVLDVCCVLVFVGIGRSSHDEAASVTGFLNTAWPFLVGVAVGWALLRVWRRRADAVPVGAGVWLSTVAVGMVLRVVSGQGIAFTFVLVALVFLGLVLVGWRGAVRGLEAVRGDKPERV